MFMFEDVTPEKAIAFTRNSIILTGCWPLPSTATSLDKIRFKALRLLFLANAILLLLPLIYAVRVHSESPDKVAKAVILSAGIIQVPIRTIFSAYHHDRFQRLVAEMKAYCANANEFERRVLQKYVDKYSAFYGTLALWIYVTVLVMILGTFFTPEPMPANAEYPFAIDSQPLRSVIFLQQSVVGMQCASHLNVNVFSALLTFFAAIRFETFSMELRTIKDIRTLAEYIKKYHDVKRYAKEVVTATKAQAVITIAACAAACIFCAISIVEKQPNSVKVQFFMLGASSLLYTFICALPCDHLMTVSENAMYRLYESEWYERTQSLRKCILIASVPQAPIILNVPCVISRLTLNYYCSFVSNVFSMFTVFRGVMVGDGD